MTPFLVRMPWLPTAPTDFAARCKSMRKEGVAPAEIKFLAAHALDTAQSANLTRVLGSRRDAGDDLTPLMPFHLGILSSATIDILCDCLPVAAVRHGISLAISHGAYGQVVQDALDPSSVLNKQRLDAVLVRVDHRWLNLDKPLFSESPKERVDLALAQIRNLVLAIRENGHAAAIIETIPIPPDPLFGNFDRRQSGTIRSMINAYNDGLIDIASDSSTYLLDTSALAERVGTDYWFDPVQWGAYKLPFHADVHPIYSDMLGRLLGAIRGRSRKCLVLDLDNTLWGGVIGDDGLDGIHLGQGSAKGEAFLAVQQMALDLRARGIFLAIASKNDDIVARRPFNEHKDMLLKESDISVFQANWIDKASNLEAIAKALNIGIDALVLLDDNPAERAGMRAALPDVAVPELPDDPGWFPRYLLAAGYFETTSFSAEDRLRVASMESNAKREEVMAKSRNIGEYLTALEMVISFAQIDRQGRERTTQLINKTNQFNLTGLRYTSDEVAALESDSKVYGLQVRIADKFGDFGMIAVLICREIEAATWQIDLWAMSCRVLGRKVEEAIVAEIVRAVRDRGAKTLIGLYRRSPKNGMVADLYPRLGFAAAGERDGGVQAFALDIESYQIQALPFEINRPQQAEAAE